MSNMIQSQQVWLEKGETEKADPLVGMDSGRLNRSSCGFNKDETGDESIGHKECSLQSSRGNEIETAKAEMSEVREENTRLKMMLEQIEKDYKSLKERFVCILRREPNRFSCRTIDNNDKNNNGRDGEEPELVSLCLGRSSSESLQKEDDTSVGKKPNYNKKKTQDISKSKEGLELGLSYDFYDDRETRQQSELAHRSSPEDSVEETNKEEEAGRDQWQPAASKGLKVRTTRSGDEELLAQQSNVKRARVSIRARCDTPTMNDGCQWRKYGQKIAKGNPCPRAYYRCTVAPSCPVRKQVQRCVEDTSILITTYEGTHNHPLPIAATAMASTTSAAASMLLSGSSASQPGLTSSSTSPHWSNPFLSDYSRTRPFCFQSSSLWPSFPTITLDLTTQGHGFNIYSSNCQSTPMLHPTSLNFSSSASTWENGFPNYGATPLLNKTSTGAFNLGSRAFQDSRNVPDHHNIGSHIGAQAGNPQHHQSLTETLTKAITSDPNFRTVVAAAITSMVGGGNATQANG